MSYGSPRFTGEILDCSMPVTFDTYALCSYDCLYCFALYQRLNRPNSTQAAPEVGAVNVDSVKALWRGGRPDNPVWPFLQRRLTVQWGGMSDAFDPQEQTRGVSLDLLRFFREDRYPLSISTKGSWIKDDPRYMDVIRGADFWHFKVSVICNDERLAAAIEKDVPPPRERFALIRALRDAGVGGVTLRYRPVIPGLSDEEREWKACFAAAADAGADAISTEYFCADQRVTANVVARYREMSRALGFDLLGFYRRQSSTAGYLRFNRASKMRTWEAMRREADRLRLRLYVSDAHGKEFSYHGSCCGLPPGFSYSRGQFTEALVLARERGRVSFADIEPHLDLYRGVPWRKIASSFKGDAAKIARYHEWTMFDWFRYQWNTPNSPSSPYRYFGGALVPVEVDEGGNVVYEYRGGAAAGTSGGCVGCGIARTCGVPVGVRRARRAVHP